MGDSESKINYTPEELAEIDRIMSGFSEVISGRKHSEEIPEEPPEQEPEELTAEDADEDDFDSDMAEEPLEEIDDDSITILDEDEFDGAVPEFDETAPEEEPPVETVTEEELPETAPEPAAEMSTLDQLDEIIRDEPGAGRDIPQTGFTDENFADAPEPEESLYTDDVSFGEDQQTAPELDALTLDETPDIPEGDISDIPEVDLDDISGPSEPAFPVDDAPDIETTADENEDLISIDDFDETTPVKSRSAAAGPGAPPRKTDIDDLERLDLESLESEFESDFKEAEEDKLEIEPLDDEPESEKTTVKRTAPDDAAEKPLELSSKDLNKLRKALLLYNPGLRTAVKEAVVNDRLPAEEVRTLVEMILSGKKESEVRSFLEKRLGIRISDEPETRKRKVITSRPEYTRAGIERQKRLLRMTKIFGISAVAAFILAITGYQYLYKPLMAKKTINEGTALILGSRYKDFYEREKDIKQAETLFENVKEKYVKKYIYGYNSYGNAYFSIKQYDRALEKLNESYRINPYKIEILNSLGRFYSRLPDEKYAEYQPRVMEWYYTEKHDSIKPKTELAIDFYSRVLIRDKENITAKLGIGDVYFQDGQYLKAKKYYEDILKIDPKSTAGYSGLLNLYIERDIFEQVLQTHINLSNKKMLEKIPSPLLAKTADYYLGKHDRDRIRPRITYGIDSPKFIDEYDRLTPSIRSVLTALNNRDSKYPPLHYNYARLQRMDNNRELMRRHLEIAISLEPDYFDANHLMGEFYFQTNQPVRAYQTLKKALDSLKTPPLFTEEDFYSKTESPGKTNFILGNVFYYFFDRLSTKRGSLRHEIIEEETEQFANYEIARRYYETAISGNFSSPELHYNLGRIYYLERRYESALNQWSNLYEDFVEVPELMLSLGNAFYKNGNLNAARGEYLTLIASLERQAEEIRKPMANNPVHYRVLMSLSSAHNNLAAVYQLQGDETRTSVNYWKAIDYSRRLVRENEYARVNLARAFRGESPEDPIIDENIPYSIEYYRKEMRRF